MHSYVAFIGQPDGPQPGSIALRLQDSFRRLHPHWHHLDWGKGSSVYHSSSSGRSAGITVLPAGCGVILGTLFSTDLDCCPRRDRPAIGESLARDMARTRGRRLLQGFWGSYVAFLSNAEGSEHYVLRDPSAMIPCYTITCQGVTVAASNLNDLNGLPMPRFSINARYLAGFICEAEMAHSECGVQEVTELLAGQCLEISEVRTRQRSMWDPRAICREGAFENFEDACGRVRRVTQACVDSWASKYDRIVHRLSGGLDSSVVLGCLKRAPYSPQITCLHWEAVGAGESERKFAQLVADEARMELVVQPGYSSHAAYDERVFDLPKAPKPSVANLAITLESNLRNLVPSQVRAETVWDGQGGDHLFFESRSALGAVDHAFRHGFTRELLNCVRDSVRRSRSSYWCVLGKAIGLGVLGVDWQPANEFDRTPAFLNPEWMPAKADEYIWQPWLSDASDLPPGKRLQICFLSWLLHRHRPVPELQYASEHHPLFSQPLMELCLRIPTYTLLRGGINRAVERAAFRDYVPERILRRETKGSVSVSLMSKIRECLPFLRDLMLDGVLVQERIVQRVSLERFLAGRQPVNNQTLWPFLSCMAAEVWARKWAGSDWRI